jgi:hypothetical protein
MVRAGGGVGGGGDCGSVPRKAMDFGLRWGWGGSGSVAQIHTEKTISQHATKKYEIFAKKFGQRGRRVGGLLCISMPCLKSRDRDSVDFSV